MAECGLTWCPHGIFFWGIFFLGPVRDAAGLGGSIIIFSNQPRRVSPIKYRGIFLCSSLSLLASPQKEQNENGRCPF